MQEYRLRMFNTVFTTTCYTNAPLCYVHWLSCLRYGRSAIPAVLCGVRIVGHLDNTCLIEGGGCVIYFECCLEVSGITAARMEGPGVVSTAPCCGDMEGVEVYLYALLTLALNGGEWSVSIHCHFTPGRSPDNFYIGGRVD
jgi:hypothetical protein